jgi:hypothetical protein
MRNSSASWLPPESFPPNVDRQVVIPVIGTIDPGEAVAAERAYIGAFFDLHLRHRGGSLLARPSPAYPQVQFLAR